MSLVFGTPWSLDTLITQPWRPDVKKTLLTFATGLAAAAAMALSPGVASAGSRVDWSISIGAPAYYEPAPIYQAAPVYQAAPAYAPYGVYQAPAPVYAPAYVYTDPWQERAWRRQQWREQRLREQLWRERMWHRQHGYW